MRYKLLFPDQILTLKDYPVYNEHILKIYFRIFSNNCGKILPPCPVIHKSCGIPFAKGKDSRSRRYNDSLKNFLDKNPKVKYFLIDGSHKTTAACLANKKIPVVILEKNSDFRKAIKLTCNGEFFGWHSPESSIKKSLGVLAQHHMKANKLLTVGDKTKLMIKNRDVPNYMIDYFKKKINYYRSF